MESIQSLREQVRNGTLSALDAGYKIERLEKLDGKVLLKGIHSEAQIKGKYSDGQFQTTHQTTRTTELTISWSNDLFNRYNLPCVLTYSYAGDSRTEWLQSVEHAKRFAARVLGKGIKWTKVNF